MIYRSSQQHIIHISRSFFRRLNPSITWADFIKSAFFAFLLLFNLFGVRTASNDHSEALMLDLMAPYFDVNHEIAVVILIDDEFIETNKLKYPVNYKTLARLLKIISAHEPRATFFDILQHFEHSGRLGSWLKQLKKSSNNHPIYLAQDLDFDTAVKLNDKDNLRYKLNQFTIAAPVSWKGQENRYPLIVDINKIKKPTAGLLLYQHFCSSINSKCNLDLSKKVHFNDSMVVRWNNDFHFAQEDYFKLPEGCMEPRNGFLDFIIKHISYGATSSEYRENKRVKCYPVLTIPASHLLSSGAAKSKKLSEAIQNKYVFIGYDIAGSADKVISPVHLQLPGVFYHALAFLNLTTNGTEYWKSPSSIEGVGFSVADLLQAVFYMSILLIASMFRTKITKDIYIRQYKLASTVSKYLIGYLITMSSIFAIAIYFPVFSNILGPLNWLAYLGVVFIGFFTVIQPVITENMFRKIRLKVGELKDEQNNGC